MEGEHAVLFHELDVEIKKISDRLDRSDERFYSSEKSIDFFRQSVMYRFDLQNMRHDTKASAINRIEKRIEELNKEREEINTQLESIIKWARKVSEKTGIPLEKL